MHLRFEMVLAARWLFHAGGGLRTSAAARLERRVDFSHEYQTMEPGAVQSGTWFGMITTRGIGGGSAMAALFEPRACLETVRLLAKFEIIRGVTEVEGEETNE
jgi:hypothetical protein